MPHRSACAFSLTRIQRHSGQALALHLVPGTDLGTLFASIDWRCTWCLAPIRAPCLLASDLASHPVPGTDSGILFASIYLALHPVPGTDSGRHRFGPRQTATEAQQGR